jgi:hypothetical protein
VIALCVEKASLSCALTYRGWTEVRAGQRHVFAACRCQRRRGGEGRNCGSRVAAEPPPKKKTASHAQASCRIILEARACGYTSAL